MKKILLLITLLLPLGVKAMDYSEKFHVGDSVNVALYSIDEVASSDNSFHVLRESASGDQTVTLIYDGVLEASPSIYDNSSYVLGSSMVYQNMQNAIMKNGQKWNSIQESLLNEEDLTSLGITRNSYGVYEIPAKYSFLAPIKKDGLTSNMYNYWTSIPENTTDGQMTVYCVTNNEYRTSDSEVYATLEARNITSECGIRPVIIIDKQYVISNNTRKSKNPSTGITEYIVPLAGIIFVAGVAVVLTKKKNVFKEI